MERNNYKYQIFTDDVEPIFGTNNLELAKKEFKRVCFDYNYIVMMSEHRELMKFINRI